ncbi:MAG: NupC/NupG family nucleoside CNT transporter [Myxococcales bacterium]|nr:NupC/NupG family nucleoside CNT transporter [Myxococcales bacterium]
MDQFMSFVGILALLGLAWLMSNNRRLMNWQTIGVGLLLQVILGAILLKWQPGIDGISAFSDGVKGFLKLSEQGSGMVFQDLGLSAKSGFQFAFQILPTIIFFSAVMAVLYYLGLMQIIISFMAKFVKKAMGTSGSETLSVSANIFVGQTEAPLMIRPFLPQMTKSELFTVMVGGFATVAGGVLAAYIGMGVDAGHLVVASVMSAPAALVVAKIMYPETEVSQTAGDVALPDIDSGDNVIDAAARGATDGLKLALNVAAMLIAFLGLVAVADWLLGGLDSLIDGSMLGGEQMANKEFSGFFPGSLTTIFGTLLAPIAFVMGVPWADAAAVGNLLGQKLAVNEFVGYQTLSDLIKSGTITERSAVISTYALCGFANFGSIGIQIGGIAALAPERRKDLASMGFKAMLGGAFATWLTACVAGLMIGAPTTPASSKTVTTQPAVHSVMTHSRSIVAPSIEETAKTIIKVSEAQLARATVGSIDTAPLPKVTHPDPVKSTKKAKSSSDTK